MKRMIWLSALFFLISACTPEIMTEETSPQEEPVSSQKRCGDSICDGPENAANCPEDCNEISTSQPQTALIREGEKAGTYWITNKSSAVPLYTQILQPIGVDVGTSPVLILVPGGIGTIDPAKAQKLADEGFTVVFFDPDGRGNSPGMENYGGTIQQDGLAAVIFEVAQLPEVDETRMGLASFSYGVTMSTGTLARYPDLPILFYIDWEGPVNRHYTTVGCVGNTMKIDWQPCDNHEWWAEREAMNFIDHLKIPYQRLQSEKDHVQATNNHAIEIVNAAVEGNIPWARLNDHPANQSYDINNQPAMYPENGETGETLIARHALELFEMEQ
ncbi:MAG: hypothetical protein HN390_16750 [Anaerolineae bacterium]|jgi:pimeloyl-ACP methyl ester carboxylesterase|nr:hypothetical protein [Anaerolineae bacterium]MBT7191999.1 hypothetical protein [Anaerolineae bacterium]MBT7992179.1 hypothetical protein [Anaerolineae bacterium]